MESKELAQEAVRVLDRKKGKEIRMIGIREISSLADYFVLATGTSSTQVKALADEVQVQLKEKGEAPVRTEGYHSHSWVLIDYGNVVVHVFTTEARRFYDLDRLWQDGNEVDLSDLLSQE